MIKKRAVKPHKEEYVFHMIAVIFLITATAYAGPKVTSFRCGNREIKGGITKYTAIEMCGEPSTREIKANQGSARNEIEEWYYNCVSGKRSYLLVFKGQNLNSIERIIGEGKSGCPEVYAEKDKEESPKINLSNNIISCEDIQQKLEKISKKANIPSDDLMEEAFEYLEEKYVVNGK